MSFDMITWWREQIAKNEKEIIEYEAELAKPHGASTIAMYQEFIERRKADNIKFKTDMEQRIKDNAFYAEIDKKLASTPNSRSSRVTPEDVADAGVTVALAVPGAVLRGIGSLMGF